MPQLSGFKVSESVAVAKCHMLRFFLLEMQKNIGVNYGDYGACLRIYVFMGRGYGAMPQ